MRRWKNEKSPDAPSPIVAETRMPVIPLSQSASRRIGATSTGAQASAAGSTQETPSGPGSRHDSRSAASVSARRARASPSSPLPASVSASSRRHPVSAAAWSATRTMSAGTSRRRPLIGSSGPITRSARRSMRASVCAGGAWARCLDARSTSRPSRWIAESDTRPPNQAAAASSRRCASSKITASCSGRIPPSPLRARSATSAR